MVHLARLLLGLGVTSIFVGLVALVVHFPAIVYAVIAAILLFVCYVFGYMILDVYNEGW